MEDDKIIKFMSEETYPEVANSYKSIMDILSMLELRDVGFVITAIISTVLSEFSIEQQKYKLELLLENVWETLSKLRNKN